MPEYYPPLGFHFRVDFSLGDLDLGDDTELRFQEVTGLRMALDEEPLEIGGLNNFALRLPKRAKFGDLVLKRGMLPDTKLRPWFEAVFHTLITVPIPIRVTLLNEQHDPLSSWMFHGAWPKSWEWGRFHAQEGKLMIETVTIAYQYMTRLL